MEASSVEQYIKPKGTYSNGTAVQDKHTKRRTNTPYLGRTKVVGVLGVTSEYYLPADSTAGNYAFFSYRDNGGVT